MSLPEGGSNAFRAVEGCLRVRAGKYATRGGLEISPSVLFEFLIVNFFIVLPNYYKIYFCLN